MKVEIYPVRRVEGAAQKRCFENVKQVCLRDGALLALDFGDGAQLDFVVPNLLGWYTELTPEEQAEKAQQEGDDAC